MSTTSGGLDGSSKDFKSALVSFACDGPGRQSTTLPRLRCNSSSTQRVSLAHCLIPSMRCLTIQASNRYETGFCIEQHGHFGVHDLIDHADRYLESRAQLEVTKASCVVGGGLSSTLLSSCSGPSFQEGSYIHTKSN